MSSWHARLSSDATGNALAPPSLWRRIKQFYRNNKWYIFILSALLMFWLGCAGFYQLALDHPHLFEGQSRPSWTALMYASLSLFPIQSGLMVDLKHTNLSLEVSRFGAPFVATFTAIEALALVFHEQIQAFRLRWIRDHVVLCGLGQKGYLMAKQFHQAGYRTLAIESDESNAAIPLCRDLGIHVLAGDATQRDTLRRAGAPRARYLIAFCGNDATNAEIAMHARDLVKRYVSSPGAARQEGRVLTCILHIVSPQLSELLRERELKETSARFRLQIFNVFDSGARAMLNAFPAFEVEKERESPHTHLIVIGAGRLGRSLIIQAVRGWYRRHKICETDETAAGAVVGRDNATLKVTIIDREASHVYDLICLRYPNITRYCDLQALQMDVNSAEFQRATFLHNALNSRERVRVYICLRDDSLSLSAALSLYQHIREIEQPLFVRMSQGAGLAQLLSGAERRDDAYDRLRVFELMENTCTLELLLNGTNEVIARAIYAVYRKGEEQRGRVLDPWERLSDSEKEPNRKAAIRMTATLDEMQYDVINLTDFDADSYTFSPEEIEQMARKEHEGWMQEKLAEGWQWGEVRSDAKRRHHLLLEWEQLDEATREKNRRLVREWPATLAEAGMQLRKRAG